jgi:acylphosphatase
MVQGVGFRWFARQLGRRLNLAGWVRNRDDGSVELAADGSERELFEFINEIQAGPPGAQVDEVRRLPVDSLAALPRPFTILH